MDMQTFHQVPEGGVLPAMELPPVSRLNLALYCGASGDHNPIHVDTDFARNSGLPDVISHGMLLMAWLGRALTNWVPQTALREFHVRFGRMTYVGEQITCTATRGAAFERATPTGSERCVRLQVTATDAGGVIKLSGDAVVSLAAAVWRGPEGTH